MTVADLNIAIIQFRESERWQLRPVVLIVNPTTWYRIEKSMYFTASLPFFYNMHSRENNALSYIFEDVKLTIYRSYDMEEGKLEIH